MFSFRANGIDTMGSGGPGTIDGGLRDRCLNGFANPSDFKYTYWANKSVNCIILYRKLNALSIQSSEPLAMKGPTDDTQANEDSIDAYGEYSTIIGYHGLRDPPRASVGRTPDLGSPEI